MILKIFKFAKSFANGNNLKNDSFAKSFEDENDFKKYLHLQNHYANENDFKK